MAADLLAGRSGGFSFSRGSSSARSAPGSSRSYGSSRPRTGATTHITNNVRVTNVRIYGGHAYPYRGGGWGYSYYGPHPYFDSWYGYPIYYGYPGHWSGWDWPIGILAILIVLAGIAAAFQVWAARW